MRTASSRAYNICLFVLALILVSAAPVVGTSKLLRVGVDDNPPFCSFSAEGKVQGLFPDVFEDIASKEGWKYEYVRCSRAQCLEYLAKGKLDLLLSTGYSPQRAERMDFSKEFLLVNWGQVYVSDRKKLESITQLENKRVAMVRGNIHSIAFRRLMADFGKDATFIEVDSMDDVFTELSRGNADAGIVNRVFGQANAEKYGVYPTSISFIPIEIKFAVPKGKHAGILAAIDSHVARLKQQPDSVYARSYEHWIGSRSVRRVLPDWVLPAVGATLIAGLFLILGVFWLRHEVSRKTAALSRAKEEAESNQRLYMATLDNSPQLQGLLSPDGTVLNVNQTALNIICAKKEAVVGCLFWESPFWSHDRNEQEHIKDAVARCAKGESLSFETTHRDFRGNLLYIDFSLHPVRDNAGAINYLIPEGRDISEQKRAEKEKEDLQARLLQAQKLEAIGTLAGGMAHDFNNILQAMSGYLSLFLMKAPAELDVSYLKQTESMIERAASLTRSMLAFSRQQQAEMSQFDLNEMVGQFHAMLARVIGEQIVLHVRLAPAELNILGNRGLLEQVLMNIAINARDAMPNGGELRVEVDAVDLSEAAAFVKGCPGPGNYAGISISDTGIGMSPEILQKVFEPFFTTKAVGQGTGLGLAVSFGTIHQHGGNITVYSEEGIGTTFRIYLPLSGKAPEFTRQEKLEAVLGGTETVLFVEDFGQIRDTMRIVLEAHGYRVIEAVDGADALDKFMASEKEIDIVVTDVVMPNMNGKELADRIRQRRPDMRFIFVSGYTPEALKEKLHENFGAIMTKPVSPALLVNKIRNMLDGQKD
jgi:two-component system, cell cycle sensor histidine kinase and response regulator CckA